MSDKYMSRRQVWKDVYVDTDGTIFTPFEAAIINGRSGADSTFMRRLVFRKYHITIEEPRYMDDPGSRLRRVPKTNIYFKWVDFELWRGLRDRVRRIVRRST